MNDADLARNYILDRLTDEDRDACERRFLFDPEFETVMNEQERTLLDDYVNSRLSPQDAEAVQRRVAQEPGHLFRLRFAESLRRASGGNAFARPMPEDAAKTSIRQRRGFFSPRRMLWLGAAACAAVILLVFAVARIRNPQPPSVAHHAVPAPSAPASAPSASNASQSGNMTAKTAPARQDPSAIATFVLLAGQQRGESTIPTLAIKPETTTLRLQLTTEEGLDEGAYTASLTNSRGERILGASRLHPRVEAGRGYIDLRVQAALLIPGGYAIDLTPEPVSNSSPVLSYRFTLARIPSISAPSQ